MRILRKKIKGFSLVEIIVVLGLFSSIATLVLGALFNVQAINGRLQGTQAILDNVNLSLQTITRDIRYGSEYHCASSVPNSIPTTRNNCTQALGGGTVLIFKPHDAENSLDRVMYYVQNGVLYREEHDFGQAPQISQMTARDLVIESLIVYVDGAQTSTGSNDLNNAIDYKQPFISLLLSGKSVPVNLNRKPVTFSIQTGISARELDNK